MYRELTVGQQDWDEPLPVDREADWLRWTDPLTALEHLQIHRPFVPVSSSHAQRRELCIFSDASTTAIAAAEYLRVVDTSSQCHVGFIMGKSKLTPSSAHTIPRLELCAAVSAVELAQVIIDESDIEFHVVNFYADSRIVLGYIINSMCMWPTELLRFAGLPNQNSGMMSLLTRTLQIMGLELY